MDYLDSFFHNEQAKGALRGFLSAGRLPHAILLEGPAGCGKKTFAALIAMTAVCRAEHDVPCGVCPECRRVQQGMHPDVEIYSADGGARSFHIDRIREIRADAYRKPNQAPYKVYILANAQEMTQQAQNALLKILEEPPESTIFVLTCESRTALLETVRSRVAILPILPLAEQDVFSALRTECPTQPEDACRAAAKMSRGSIGAALALLQEPERLARIRQADAFLEKHRQGDTYGMLTILTQTEKKREDFLTFLQDLRAGYIRETADAQHRLRALQNIVIIDKIIPQAENNGNPTLLSALLCAQLQ